MTDEGAITISAEDKKAMFDVLVTITHCLARQDTEKGNINEIVGAAQDKFKVNKKYFVRMAKVMYAKSFENVQEEAATFEALYETIVGEAGAVHAKD